MLGRKARTCRRRDIQPQLVGVIPSRCSTGILKSNPKDVLQKSPFKSGQELRCLSKMRRCFVEGALNHLSPRTPCASHVVLAVGKVTCRIFVDPTAAVMESESDAVQFESLLNGIISRVCAAPLLLKSASRTHAPAQVFVFRNRLCRVAGTRGIGKLEAKQVRRPVAGAALPSQDRSSRTPEAAQHHALQWCYYTRWCHFACRNLCSTQRPSIVFQLSILTRAKELSPLATSGLNIKQSLMQSNRIKC